MIDILEGQERDNIARDIGIIKDFLLFKKEYEGKDFMSIRDSIVPGCFSEKDFCEHMKILRQQ